MSIIARTMNALFDMICSPFGSSAEMAVFVLSVVTGLAMLLLFKKATNQERLATARRVLIGRIFEMGLFQDHLGVLFRIQKDLALANLRYLRWSLPALFVMLIPMVLILAQMDARYGHRPFVPGETTLVSATLANDQSEFLTGISLQVDEGMVVESLPVRNFETGSATWRVRVEAEGEHLLKVSLADGRNETKLVVAGDGVMRLASVREQESLVRTLLNSAEDPLPGDSPLQQIAVQLPPRDLFYFGVRTDWLLALCFFSVLFGLAVKDLFRVQF